MPLVAGPGIRPAISGAATNASVIASDPKWNDYGDYLRRLIDAVQKRWEADLNTSPSTPESGTHVRITFVLKSDGSVARIAKIEDHTSPTGVEKAVLAITGQKSYGVWPVEMKTALGEEQEITFVFHYD